MERLSARAGEREREGRGEDGRLVVGGEWGGESKQSLVNFPEGRPRAWLGRGPWDGPIKEAAPQPIKRQAGVSSSMDGEGEGRARGI